MNLVANSAGRVLNLLLGVRHAASAPRVLYHPVVRGKTHVDDKFPPRRQPPECRNLAECDGGDGGARVGA